MTRFLTLIVAASALALASCATSKKEECSSCCKTDAAKTKKVCCDKDKSSAHKH
jgi:hypothetical protein